MRVEMSSLVCLRFLEFGLELSVNGREAVSEIARCWRGSILRDARLEIWVVAVVSEERCVPRRRVLKIVIRELS